MQDNKDKIREKNIDNISKHIADTKINNRRYPAAGFAPYRQ